MVKSTTPDAVRGSGWAEAATVQLSTTTTSGSQQQGDFQPSEPLLTFGQRGPPDQAAGGEPGDGHGRGAGQGAVPRLPRWSGHGDSVGRRRTGGPGLSLFLPGLAPWRHALATPASVRTPPRRAAMPTRDKAIGLLVALGMSVLAAACTAPGDKTGDTTDRAADGDLGHQGRPERADAGAGCLHPRPGPVSGGRMTVHLPDRFGHRKAADESGLVRRHRGRSSRRRMAGDPRVRRRRDSWRAGGRGADGSHQLRRRARAGDRACGPDRAVSAGQRGILALGLLVGPLRRPFAAERPLLGPADGSGVRFRSFHSAVQDQTIEALGGTPVEVGADVSAAVRGGRLRGAELDVAQYLINGGGTEAGNVTANVVLWPKVLVLTFNAARLRGLTAEERGWVGTAAAMATRASVRAPYDEATAAAGLCQRGVRFAAATTDQLRDLRSRVAPVLTALALGPNRGTCARRGPGGRGGAPRHRRSPRSGHLPARGGSTGAAVRVPRSASALPDGVYRTQITREMLTTAGVDPADGYPGGTWTLTVRHATYELRCRPLGGGPDAECGSTATDKILDLGNSAVADTRSCSSRTRHGLPPSRAARPAPALATAAGS